MGKAAFLGGLCIAVCLCAWASDLAAETRTATAASYVNSATGWRIWDSTNLAIGAYGIALEFSPEFAPAYFQSRARL